MDEDRRIRFLIAPTLFLGSLLWGAWADLGWRSTIKNFLTSNNHDLNNVIGLVAAGGLVVFVAGYVIGTITHSLLRLLFLIGRPSWTQTRSHEVALRDDRLSSILAIFKVEKTWYQPEDQLYPGVAFDFGILAKEYEGVHRWLVRRWNAFSIGITSIAGLILSFVIGYCALHICFEVAWWAPVGIFLAAVVVTTVFAWRDAMGMLDFMVAVKDANPGSPTAPPSH